MTTANIPEGCIAFDLEKFKAGHPARTQAGRAVSFIAQVPQAADAFQRLVVLIDGGVCSFDEQGLTPYTASIFLVAPQMRKVVRWCSIQHGQTLGPLFESKEGAEEAAWPAAFTIARVEWEEEAK